MQPDKYQLWELTAQEVTADASVWMASAAVLTVLVTTLGTLLIWRQVRLTRQAVQDTSEATVATREANRIAEDNSHRQLRAYLSVKSVTVSESDWDEDRLQIMIEIENAGQTPAILRSVILWAAWAYEGGDVTLVRHTSKNEVPCHRDTPMHFPISFQCEDENLNNKGHLTAVGRIEYDDAFGKRLAAFSPLSMIATIEEYENSQGGPDTGK